MFARARSVKKALLLFLALFLFSFSYEDIKEAYYKSYQYEKVQDYENAIKSIMPIYKKYPKGYTLNLRLGWLYFLWGKYANSLHHYGEAMKINPYSIEAKLGYTLHLMAQGKFSEVEKLCYQILSVDPYNYYANLRLVRALKQQRKLDVALKVVNKMLAVYPTDVSFLTELALIKYSSGSKEEALSIFRDILILDPENVVAKEYLNGSKNASSGN
jgi:tetratricopeptide (TPR) repeat protein